MTGSQDRPDLSFDDDAQGWLQDRLAAEPRPVLPDDVRARFDDVIVEESRRRAAEPPAAPRRPGSGRWLLVGAAASIAVLAGVVAVPRLTSGGEVSSSVPQTAPEAASSAPGCEVTATPNADLESVTSATGTTYTAAGLPAQAVALRGQADCGRLSGTESDAGGSAYSAGTLSDCVVSVAAGRRVLAVDLAWYEDRRAVVALVRLPPTKAYVLDCATTPARVLAEADVPQE